MAQFLLSQLAQQYFDVLGLHQRYGVGIELIGLGLTLDGIPQNLFDGHDLSPPYGLVFEPTQPATVAR